MDFHSGQEGSVAGVLAGPPLQQDWKALRLLIDRPIKLRRAIIQPSLRQPFARVTVKFVVRVEPADLRRVGRTPNSKRADAELHPRFFLLDTVIDALHKSIHVVPPPVSPRQLASALLVTAPRNVVGKVY